MVRGLTNAPQESGTAKTIACFRLRVSAGRCYHRTAADTNATKLQLAFHEKSPRSAYSCAAPLSCTSNCTTFPASDDMRPPPGQKTVALVSFPAKGWLDGARCPSSTTAIVTDPGCLVVKSDGDIAARQSALMLSSPPFQVIGAETKDPLRPSAAEAKEKPSLRSSKVKMELQVLGAVLTARHMAIAPAHVLD